MLRTRVIPCLLLRDAALVKTIQFKNPSYVGDPMNAIRIYNEKEVDELIFLDITATTEKKKPSFDIIAQIANECFMPVTYGGAIQSVDDVHRILKLGIEKVAVNSFAVENPHFITEVAERFGSQSIVVSVDVKKNFWGKYKVYSHAGTKDTGLDPVEWAVKMQDMGAGELLVTSIDRDGMMKGYDCALLRRVSDAVQVPVIACGGAGKVDDFAQAVNEGGASACAAGSMVVYFGPNRAVLINFPKREELECVLV